MSDRGSDVPRLPVSPPVGVAWWGRALDPIWGDEAECQIHDLRARDRRLAKRLVRCVKDLPDRPLSVIAELVPDPPGVGPRYVCDLDDGYVAVYWVLEPPPERSGAGPALWVERLMRREEIDGYLTAMAPSEE